MGRNCDFFEFSTAVTVRLKISVDSTPNKSITESFYECKIIVYSKLIWERLTKTLPKLTKYMKFHIWVFLDYSRNIYSYLQLCIVTKRNSSIGVDNFFKIILTILPYPFVKFTFQSGNSKISITVESAWQSHWN